MPTRLGWGFLLLIGGIAFAAINTGNNLLYLLVGICFASLVVSFFAGGRALARLRAEVSAPDEILAGEATSLVVTLHNPSERDAPGVELKAWAGEATLDTYRLPPLGPGAAGSRFLPARFPRRGLVRGTHLSLTTSDPFGLVRRRRRLPALGNLFVYPRPARLDDDGDEASSDGEEVSSRRAGDGLELHQIRPYGFDDDSRHIDWPGTARQGQLMVREFLDEGNDRLLIVFDPRLEDLEEPSRRRFERQVSQAAALVLRSGERRTPLSFLTPGGELKDGDSAAGHRPILEYLATVQPELRADGAARLAPDLEGRPGVVRLGAAR